MVRSSIFINIFEAYSATVKKGHAKKLEYNKWKAIEQEIKLLSKNDTISLYFNDDEKAFIYIEFPNNIITIDKVKDKDFYNHLLMHTYIVVKQKNHNLNKNKKEKENMNTTFNFDFGQLDSNLVGLSPYGLAVMNPASNKFIAWDAKSKALIDVETLNFPEGREFFYKIPVAVKEIKAGDIIMHQYGPAFVTEVSKDYSTITVVSPNSCEQRTIVPVKSIFGFNFVTKIVSLFGDGQFTASEDAPFGNMLPLLLLSKNKDINPLIFLTMGGQTDFAKNPLLLYALMSDNKNSDALLPLLFMNNNIFKAQE